ncbi:hypothetical protein THASP1DRAFT_29216 [Thamnocephalis sphaerospora]|uniref:Uncharacterized protein n=1 Tax=Thamnocephalis sphaerospora TaxID=78915 RepID=A0A4P9XS94_9FUNG|nr:hypothetical protein THASP1DRAFT_29216 [Thamnocephalis sphaerospora]|eukprot:RKP08987.1 hypothetical protein THASP1DRAFT_29216 [Thamnocephalis sphaerospora]
MEELLQDVLRRQSADPSGKVHAQPAFTGHGLGVAWSTLAQLFRSLLVPLRQAHGLSQKAHRLSINCVQQALKDGHSTEARQLEDVLGIVDVRSLRFGTPHSVSVEQQNATSTIHVRYFIQSANGDNLAEVTATARQEGAARAVGNQSRGSNDLYLERLSVYSPRNGRRVELLVGSGRGGSGGNGGSRIIDGDYRVL